MSDLIDITGLAARLESMDNKIGILVNNLEANNAKIFYNSTEVRAQLGGISKGVLYTLIKRDGLPYHRIGRVLKFRREEVEKWAEKQ
nr:hypothetical protein 8 [bacterium]